MGADQVEHAVVLALACAITALGYGLFDTGAPAKARASMRWSGPLAMAYSAAQLIATFVR